MISQMRKYRTHPVYRMVSGIMAFTFVFSVVMPPSNVFAQAIPMTVLNLPVPGAMIPLTSGFTPAMINGITIHPNDPFTFDFLIGRGDNHREGEELTNTADKLIKYFLASLTVPEEDLWVNLSPYEQDRIIPDSLSQTEIGRDLLAQDYILKQLTASLMYPENELGKKFWDRIHQKVQDQYGIDDLPVDTFNKVWIVPQDATVYESQSTAIVVDSYLKVMLESDYLALQNAKTSDLSFGEQSPSAEIIKEVIIPTIEKEVNEGETFANLRQIYNSMILATWYKKNLKRSLLGKVYIDQKKVDGIDTVDSNVKDEIYKQYLEAFKVGVYDYIREEYDPASREIVPRKYFAGGTSPVREDNIVSRQAGQNRALDADAARIVRENDAITVELRRSSSPVGQGVIPKSALSSKEPVVGIIQTAIGRLITDGKVVSGLNSNALYDLAVAGEKEREQSFKDLLRADAAMSRRVTHPETGEEISVAELKIEQFEKQLANDFKTRYGSTIYTSHIANRSAGFTYHLEADGFEVGPGQKAADPKLVERLLAAVVDHLKNRKLIQVDRTVGEDPDESRHFKFFVDANYGRLAHELTALHFPAKQGAESQNPDILTIDLPDFDVSQYGLSQKDDGSRHPYILRIPNMGITFILGTDYFGEVKKSALTMNGYLAKRAGDIAIHAGSKIVRVRDSKTGKIVEKRVIASGLSGTGKTTTLAGRQGLGVDDGEEESILLQDDFIELRFGRDSSDGRMTGEVKVIGLEKGSYYKTERLDRIKEPELFLAARKPTTILENVYMRQTGQGLKLDYDDLSMTGNGRGIVTREALLGKDVVTRYPSVDMDGIDVAIWLTRSNSIVPAGSLLTPEQGAAYWLLGESVLTSAATNDPKLVGKPVNSPGFSPFIVGSVSQEANRLLDFFRASKNIQMLLANTGRVGAQRDEAGNEDDTTGEKVGIPDSAAVFTSVFRGTAKTQVDLDWGYAVITDIDGYARVSRLVPAAFYTPDEYKERVRVLREHRMDVLKPYIETGLSADITFAISASSPVVSDITIGVLAQRITRAAKANTGELNGYAVDAASSPVGGIDLDSEYLNLKVNRDGNGIPLPVSLQPIDTMNIKGLVPIIINIAPVNMPLIFGSIDVDGNEPYADTGYDKSLDSARNEYFDKMIKDEELAVI